MEKKLINPMEDPPTASSSQEEVESSEASSSDEEASQKIIKSPSVAVTKDAPAAKQGSDSHSGSETETGSDSDSEVKNPPKSTVSAAAAQPNKKDPTSSVASDLPVVKSGKKRPVREAEGTPMSTKRGKKVTSGAEKSIKRKAFQRLWTDDDEISVLQGIVDFTAETEKFPNQDTNGFYDFVKDSFSFKPSKTQLMEKIRSLKKKYMGKNGEDPMFEKDHDQKVYKLSKHLWDLEGIASQSILKSNDLSRKLRDKKMGKQDVMDNHHQSDWFEKSFLVKSICGFGVDEHHVKQNWYLVSLEDQKLIQAKLKLLQEKELGYILEKNGFVHEVTTMMAEAAKKKL